LGKNLIPTATNFDLIDEFIKVKDEDSAHTARELAKSEGMFVGYTSGAALQAVKQLDARNEFKSSDLVVIIFPDHGTRYLSKIYSDKWMETQGFFDSKHEKIIEKIQYIK
jgi:cystathionine beta-synthase